MISGRAQMEARLLHIGPMILTCALAVAVVVLRLSSPGVLEMADGDYHYQFAKWSWWHPELLLDHWAKPLFTLLASPFAQLGPWGITLFNALLALVAAALSISMVRWQQAGAEWMIAVLLFTAPAYLHVLLAGMTEVLFGTLCIVVVWALVTERYTLATIIASFTPFARPEYVAFLPAVVAWLAWKREWRSLPWILLGLILYSLVGWPVFHDPLWFFHNDPYPGNDIYGSGAFSHFWEERDEILGEPLRKLFLVASAAMAVLFFIDGDRREEHLRMFVLTAVPAVGMWLVHSYVWWKGGHGSMGLTRVVATSIPLMVLFAVHVFAAGWRRWMPAFRWRWVVGVGSILILCNWCVNDVRSRMHLPVEPSAMQRTVDEAAERIVRTRQPGQRLVYLFPHIGTQANVDPWDTADARIIYFLDWDRHDWGMRDGDLLAWDAQLCPKDGGMPLEHLLGMSELTLEEIFVPDEQVEVFGLPFEIWLFRRGPATRELITDTLFTLERGWIGSNASLRMDTVRRTAGSMTQIRFGPELIPFELSQIPVPKGEEVLVTGIDVFARLAVPPKDGASVQLVVEETIAPGRVRIREAGAEQDSLHLAVNLPRRREPAGVRLFLNNASNAPLDIVELNVIRRSWRQRAGQ